MKRALFYLGSFAGIVVAALAVAAALHSLTASAGPYNQGVWVGMGVVSVFWFAVPRAFRVVDRAMTRGQSIS